MKKILITGTTQGLGKNIAEKFLENNWEVIGVARKLSTIVHKNYKHHCLDLKNLEESRRIFSSIEQIDVLINNASVFKMKKFVDMLDEDINEILDTNLKSTIFTTKFLIDKINPSGRIFFINSVAGIRDLNNQSIYCATKHGIRSFASILAEELRDKKIKVTSIHPGGINTPLWNDSNPYPVGDIEKSLDPAEISNLITYICNCGNSVEFKNITLFPEIEWH